MYLYCIFNQNYAISHFHSKMLGRGNIIDIWLYFEKFPNTLTFELDGHSHVAIKSFPTTLEFYFLNLTPHEE